VSINKAASSAIPTALAQFDALPDSANVRLPVVVALFGISPATAWRWVKAGILPKPHKAGPNTTAWKAGEIRRAQAGAGGATAQPQTMPIGRAAAPTAGKAAWKQTAAKSSNGAR
jgi:predicted DNA-binding transcriptional regulator AlpA